MIKVENVCQLLKLVGSGHSIYIERFGIKYDFSMVSIYESTVHELSNAIRDELIYYVSKN